MKYVLSVKPISSIDMNDLNSLASEEADKCRTKQQDADYHKDCCECYIAGYNKAISLITE